jgi:hypothetical protein
MTDKYPSASPCPFCESGDLLDGVRSWGLLVIGRGGREDMKHAAYNISRGLGTE